MSEKKSTITIDGVKHDINNIDITVNTVQDTHECPTGEHWDEAQQKCVKDTPVKVTKAKISNANQTAQKGDVVALDGSGSTSATTGIRYFWAQTEGISVIVGTLDKAIASFTAMQDGDYGFSLTVMDDNNVHDTATCKVIVKTIPPPPVDTDPGLPAKDGWFEQLDKAANQDPHTWRTVAMTKDPKLSKVVDDKSINRAVEFKKAENADQYTKHFVYVADHPPDHQCPQGYHWDIILAKCVPGSLEVTRAIIAEPSKKVTVGELTTLDGSKSTSAAGELRYAWKQTGGYTGEITNADKAVATFTPENDAVWTLRLTVTDTSNQSSSADCTLTTKTPPPPSGDTDEEGVQKLYKDDPKFADQQFFLKRDGPNHARVSGKGARKLMPNGATQITPDPGTHPASARIYIRTTNPKAMDAATQSKLGYDWVAMKDAGYMVDPFDFKDFETGCYYIITKSSAADQFTFYGRGGAHPSDDQWPLQCLGVCYKCQIEMDKMSPRGAKEYHHYGGSKGYAWAPVTAKFDLAKELGSNSIVGKMIGQKMVIYNEMGTGNEVKAVHMELYLDLASKDLKAPDHSKQNWKLWAEWIDTGKNWPEKPPNMDYVKECNAQDGQMFTWGGPYTAYRCDDNVWELHSLSVRPILVEKQSAISSAKKREVRK